MTATLYLVAWTCVVVAVLYFVQKVYKFISPYLKVDKELSKVDGPGGHWIFGQTKDLTPDEKGFLLNVERTKYFPKVQRIFRIWPFVQSLCAYWPSIMQTLLAQDGLKDVLGYGLMRPWLGDGLLMSEGSKWKRNRRLLTPAFHFEILKNYLIVFNDGVSILIDKWKDEKSVAAFADVSLMTLDNMLRCTMSTKSDCQLHGHNHPYVKAVGTLAEVTMQRFFNPLLVNEFIFNLTSKGREYRHALKITHEQSRSVIEHRKKDLEDKNTLEEIQKHRKHDFLDILLLARGEDGKGLTDKEIQDEVDTFMFEGHDTTSSAISWILYNLAIHQEYQDICRKEVKDILQGRSTLEWDDLQKFDYLTMCIKESMRTHPPVPFITRELAEATTFEKDFHNDQYNVSSTPLTNSSQTLPVGSRIEASIYTLHRNPFLWDNPEKFDPLRFTKDNIEKRSPYAYLPFSAGPRNCIGQNFAMMEIKTAISLLLRNFKFEIDKNFPKPEIQMHLILKSKTDIHLRLTRINNEMAK